MQVDAFLCNHAEAVNNMLYVSGGGVDTAQVPPGSAPPYMVSLGIALAVTVPWGQTNQEHKIRIELIGEDGESTMIPMGPEIANPIRVEIPFTVGRGANLHPGDDQRFCFAANLPGLPLPAIGKYLFVILLDGHEERRLPFRVQLANSQVVLRPA